MARRVTDPVPDEEIEALVREAEHQRLDIEDALATDLGGEPDDFREDRSLLDDEGDAVTGGGADGGSK